MEIKVWAQVFFLDGSVSQGKRIPCELLDDREALIDEGQKLLKSVNREEGYLLVWGAGELFFSKITSSSSASGIWAWESLNSLCQEHKNFE